MLAIIELFIAQNVYIVVMLAHELAFKLHIERNDGFFIRSSMQVYDYMLCACVFNNVLSHILAGKSLYAVEPPPPLPHVTTSTFGRNFPSHRNRTERSRWLAGSHARTYSARMLSHVKVNIYKEYITRCPA